VLFARERLRRLRAVSRGTGGEGRKRRDKVVERCREVNRRVERGEGVRRVRRVTRRLRKKSDREIRLPFLGAGRMVHRLPEMPRG
jgi:hypothetical protein